MRMSDLVGGLDMTIFPIVGLLIFLGLFVVVVARAVMASPSDTHDAASIPLNEESAPARAPHR